MSSASDAFCRAIIGSDMGAARAVLSEMVAADESMNTDTDPTFGDAIQHLVCWLSKCECIKNVGLSGGIMKSQPPQKLIVLTTGRPEAAQILHLTLVLGSRMQVLSLESSSE